MEQVSTEDLFDLLLTPSSPIGYGDEDDEEVAATVTPSPPLLTQSPSFLASVPAPTPRGGPTPSPKHKMDIAGDEPLLWALECVLDRVRNDCSEPALITLRHLTQLASGAQRRMEAACEGSTHNGDREQIGVLKDRLRLRSVLQQVMCKNPHEWPRSLFRTFSTLLQRSYLSRLRATGDRLIALGRLQVMLTPLGEEPPNWMLCRQYFDDSELEEADSVDPDDVAQVLSQLKHLTKRDTEQTRSSSRDAVARTLIKRFPLGEFRKQFAAFADSIQAHFPSTYLDKVASSTRSCTSLSPSSKVSQDDLSERDKEEEYEKTTSQHIQEDSPTLELEEAEADQEDGIEGGTEESEDEDESQTPDAKSDWKGDVARFAYKKRKVDEDRSDPSPTSSTRTEWIRRKPKSDELKRATTSKVRRIRRKWTDEETYNLLEGAKRFGVGNWKAILLHYDFPGRTAVDLKDKYRNLEREQDRRVARPGFPSLTVAAPPASSEHAVNSSIDDEIEE